MSPMDHTVPPSHSQHWGAAGVNIPIAPCSKQCQGNQPHSLGALGCVRGTDSYRCHCAQVFLQLLPRYLGMAMPEETPGPPQAIRRRSSLGLMVKADEYMLWKARTELLFEKQKERDGLMKTVLEKIGE